MILFTILIALVLAVLLFIAHIYFSLKSSARQNRNDCGNCGMYDKNLHTCWLRFEERFPGDAACDQYHRSDD